jgi:hypothetical protein
MLEFGDMWLWDTEQHRTLGLGQLQSLRRGAPNISYASSLPMNIKLVVGLAQAAKRVFVGWVSSFTA